MDTEILRYCSNFYDWPKSWLGIDDDLKSGDQLLRVFEPFIHYLISSGLSQKTIRGHTNNLWLLGGELVRSLHWDESLRNLKGTELVSRAIGDDGGPYSRHLSTQSERKFFDVTCRKLYKFLKDCLPEPELR